jgi:hypothetical protein
MVNKKYIYLTNVHRRIKTEIRALHKTDFG